MRGLEDLGRVRLSPNFYLRDFLYSEIANFYGVPNMPENPELAIATGRKLCEELLEHCRLLLDALAYVPDIARHRLRPTETIEGTALA